MKVVFCLDSLGIGGAEKSTLDNLSHFSKETEPILVYFYSNHALKKEFERVGIRVVQIPISSMLSKWTAIFRLYRFLKKENPDVVVSSIMTADLITRMAVFFSRHRLVGTFINDTYSDVRIEEMKKNKLYFKFRVVWFMDRITSCIPSYWISNAVSISETNAKALHINRQKIKVINRGRDTARMKPWQPPTDHSYFRFIFLGRLMERKGINELLDAFSLLLKTHPNVRLDIVGGGQYMEHVKSRIAELQINEAVVLHGSVPNGWSLFYNAHCFVFPSWYEGFSGTLIEASILGMPIICSDIPMNKEAVNEQQAVFFPVKDVSALYQAMLSMVSSYDDASNNRFAMREQAIREYDINVIASKYEAFLRSII